MPKLVTELPCSLRPPGKFGSLFRNQHRPRHLAPPLTDDQHGGGGGEAGVTCSSHSFSAKNLKSIDTKSTPSKSSWASDFLCGETIPRPTTQNVHHDRCGRCVVMCSLYSLAVGHPGSRKLLTCGLPSSSSVSPSSMSSSSVSPFNSMSFSSFYTLDALSHSD